MDESVSPRFELLLACLAWPIDAGASQRIAQAAQRVEDWGEFVALVVRHRVAAQVWPALQGAGIGLPPDCAQALRQGSAESVLYEMAYARESASLFSMLGDAGIDALILKGVASALLCYGRLGLKFSRDVDILVREEEVEHALALLEARGYAPEAGTEPRDPIWRRRHKDVCLSTPASPILVELHWRLFDNPVLLDAPRAEAALPLVIPGCGTIHTLGRDLGIVYLCLHGAQHAWSRLKWLAEIHALLRDSDDDELSRLYRFAATRRGGRALAQALILRGRLFGASVPVEIVKAESSDWRIRWLVKVALRSAMRGGSAEMESLPMGSTAKNMSHYLLSSGLRYWWQEFVFDSNDKSAVEGGQFVRRLGPIGRVIGWFLRARQQRAALHPS